jgi:hypothetical protein
MGTTGAGGFVMLGAGLITCGGLVTGTGLGGAIFGITAFGFSGAGRGFGGVICGIFSRSRSFGLTATGGRISILGNCGASTLILPPRFGMSVVDCGMTGRLGFSVSLPFGTPVGGRSSGRI